MPEQFEEPILNYLGAQTGEAIKVSDLAERMNIAPDDRQVFEQAVEQLAKAGRVVWGGGGSGRMIALPAMGNQVVGTFRQTLRGFGFLIPDAANAHGDLFIPAGENLDAVTGDFVIAKVVVREKYDMRDPKKAISGRIIEILKRATNRAVGTLTQQHGRWVVIPDGNIFKAPIEVQDATAKNAVDGDKVVVELLRFPGADTTAQGVIAEVLGAHGEPEVELQSVIRQYDLPREFPEAVMQQARTAATNYDPKDYGDREDLSDEVIATIDPTDARDFDDAISLKILKGSRSSLASKGHDSDEDADALMRAAAENATVSAEDATPMYELGVHIADVSAFVPVESAMDMEARSRGNSTYFPKYVIPMLPEILSNGVCSLQEGQPRLTKSAFIRYDARGRVVSARVANTIIRSRKRLTYQNAQAVIDDAKGEGQPYSKGLLDSPVNPNVPQVEPEVRELLVRMDRLARLIRQRRLEAGMIVLDLPVVELVMDAEGHVIDAKPEDDSFTHKIIEMFMVEANEAVARFLLTKHNVPVLRRVHPDPDIMSAEQVRQFVMVAGRRVPKVLDRAALQGLLDSVRGTPIAYAVHLAVLKTFSTAEYSPLGLGHYALASDNYAHFTSPIRRYADLVIHRCINAVLQSNAGGKKKKRGGRGEAATKSQALAKVEAAASAADKPLASGVAGQARGMGLMPEKLGDVPDYGTLVQLGKHLSYTERRSSDAERELRTVKVLQLLAEHVGDVIDGVVTGVTGFGVFVQSTRFLSEGMIRTADLPDDFWMFDDKSGVLRGQRTGRRIALGDRAKVQIVSVNIPARQLELRLLEHGSSIAGETTMRRVSPPVAGRGKVPPDQARDDSEFPGRKKNFGKRMAHKEAARGQGQPPVQGHGHGHGGPPGAPGAPGSRGQGRGRGRKNRGGRHGRRR